MPEISVTSVSPWFKSLFFREPVSILDASANKTKMMNHRDTEDTERKPNGRRAVKWLSNLEQLGLAGTGVTDDGVQFLKKSFPHCPIWR